MNKLEAVRTMIDCQMSAEDISAYRAEKHEVTRRLFSEMVKIKDIDSLVLFNLIHACFEEQSKSRPYHDWYHTCCVVEGTIQGLRYHLSNKISAYSESQQNEINSTILAAAFHDAGHAGVSEPDIVNVSRSIMIARDFLASIGINGKSTALDDVNVAFMLETLQSTQYPFKYPPQNEYQAILRDADLLQILEPTWFDDIYVNMYQEFQEGNPDLDFETFSMNEMSFISSAKFYSVWFFDQKENSFSDIALSRVRSLVAM